MLDKALSLVKDRGRMATIQALNKQTNPHQAGFRLSIWAGRENTPGLRGDWVVYASNIQAAVGKGLRHFRRVIAPKARFSDWTINVEPLRADETIVAETKHRQNAA